MRYRSSGQVWQGRFQSPVIRDDEHLMVVLRSIEADPLRARMAADPAEDRWSSYQAHSPGRDGRLLSPFTEWEALDATESERRERRAIKVGTGQDEPELMAVRRSLTSGRPFGSAWWVEGTAERLGIDLGPRPRGRPRKEK